MALNWNIADIKDYKEKCHIKIKEGERGYVEGETNYRLHDMIDRLIWRTIHIGIREITEKNCEQFYSRCKLFEIVYLGSPDYKYTTLEDIKNHIGLWTNASTYTKSQFVKNLTESHERSYGKL